jgi:hypothetical protein
LFLVVDPIHVQVLRFGDMPNARKFRPATTHKGTIDQGGKGKLVETDQGMGGNLTSKRALRR